VPHSKKIFENWEWCKAGDHPGDLQEDGLMTLLTGVAVLYANLSNWRTTEWSGNESLASTARTGHEFYHHHHHHRHRYRHRHHHHHYNKKLGNKPRFFDIFWLCITILQCHPVTRRNVTATKIASNNDAAGQKDTMCTYSCPRNKIQTTFQKNRYN